MPRTDCCHQAVRAQPLGVSGDARMDRDPTERTWVHTQEIVALAALSELGCDQGALLEASEAMHP